MQRIEGYLPIGDYAAIGDGRCVALVGRDGSIDWMPLPGLDAPSPFSAILDASRGGRFELSPAMPFEVERGYLGDSNVLQTTFTTAEGSVRVTDAFTLHEGALLPWTELVRRIECLSGAVEMHWRVDARFDWGNRPARFGHRGGTFFADDGELTIAVGVHGAGDPSMAATGPQGRCRLEAGDSAVLNLLAVDGEPLPEPDRRDLDDRLDRTIAFWQRWSTRIPYQGPWRDAVVRSALVLKLLLHSPTGAIAAAPTTSLPERIGGDRNYDYRYAWLRDTSFTLDALARLRLWEEAHLSLNWLLSVAKRTHPRLSVFYALGGAMPREETIELDELEGYRGSRPVRIGNGALGQTQLGTYGDLFQTVWVYAAAGNRLDDATGRMLATTADYVSRIWRHADSGIWELKAKPERYTISKIGCWVSMDRALRLAADGQIPADGAARWKDAEGAARDFVERQCWSDRLESYTMHPGTEAVDAACLLASRLGFAEPSGPRMHGTIRAVRDQLGAGGSLLYRYGGVQEEEGAFVACSFWLVEALARAGRLDEAAAWMDGVVGRANDVGLLSEEIDPASGELLGNFPQGLSHLALVNAATTLEECTNRDAEEDTDR